jgi:hypothetical protein
MTDRLFLFIFLLFFGSVIYYVLFRSPKSDMLFSSDSNDEIFRAQTFLNESGIKTYIKNREQSRYSYYGSLPKASLHVVNTEDREKALSLLGSCK